MWLERKQIHKGHWYWYRRWRADGHVRSRYVGRSRAGRTADLAVSESGQAQAIATVIDAPGQVTGQAATRGPDLMDDLAANLVVSESGQAQAIADDPIDVAFNFPGDESIVIINVAPGAQASVTASTLARPSITTNGVPAGNAAPGREDVSSMATRDRPASKEDAP